MGSFTSHNLLILSSIQLAMRGTEPVPLLPVFTDVFSQNSADEGQIYVAVMPKVERSACWYALGLSLAKAKQGFERRLEQHSLEKFTPGDWVELLPWRAVYEFAGLYSDYQLIKLSLIDDPKEGSFSLPLEQISRLQHASHEGKIAKKVPTSTKLELTPLDLVIDTSSFGNADFFDTEVIYLGRKALFQSAMTEVEIARIVNKQLQKFSSADILPWGRITTDGKVRLESYEASHARPLIARANSALDIIQFCKFNHVHKRHIVVDGVQLLQRELASLCRLMDEFECEVIAFCGFKDFQALRELEGTGRILARQVRPEKINVRKENGVFQPVASAACRAINFEWIDTVNLAHEIVDATADGLEQISEALETMELETESDWLVGRAFNILRAVANPQLSGLHPPEVTNSIANLKDSFGKIRLFWPAAERLTFLEILKNLDMLAEAPSEIAKVKRTAVEDLIGRPLSQQELSNEGVTFVSADDGETLVLSGWPRRSKVQQVVFDYQFKKIIATAFAFEERWFRFFNRSYREAELYAADDDTPYRPTNNQINPERFSSLCKKDKFVMADPDRGFIKSTLAPLNDDDREASLPARLIWFSDEHICPLSEGGKLPTIKNLGRSMGKDNLQIDLMRASQIEHGDLCIFRAGADTDLVKSLARHSVGADLYDEKRAVADSWQHALATFMMHNQLTIVDLQRRLSNAGLYRTITTLRLWLYSPMTIGPKEQSDLLNIFKAIRATDLLPKISDIWLAIKAIRSWHRSAGANISAMLKDELISSLSRTEALIGHFKLSLGEVDILEVESVDEEDILVKVNLANRLLLPERLEM